VFQLRDLKRATIRVNGKPVQVWVMDDPGKRQEGMMFLKDADVKNGEEGMLFVFPDVQPGQPDRGFWMRNTLIALDIVYISPAKKVVNIQVGKPLDETSLPATGDFQYVLELEKGGAASLGIEAGTTIEIPADITAQQ